MGQQIADPFAALAVLPPAPGALHDMAGIGLKQLDAAAGIERLPVAANQLRLVVECIALARGTGHEELDDTLRLGAMVQAAVEVLASRER